MNRGSIILPSNNCCCGCPEGNEVPSVNVVLDGIALCSGCIGYSGPEGGGTIKVSGSSDGTYGAGRFGTSGTIWVAYVATLTERFFSDGDCIDNIGESSTYNFFVSCFVGEDKQTWIGVQLVSTETGTRIFQGSAPFTRGVPVVINNDYSGSEICGTGFDGTIVGYGGTATITV